MKLSTLAVLVAALAVLAPHAHAATVTAGPTVSGFTAGNQPLRIAVAGSDLAMISGLNTFPDPDNYAAAICPTTAGVCANNASPPSPPGSPASHNFVLFTPSTGPSVAISGDGLGQNTERTTITSGSPVTLASASAPSPPAPASGWLISPSKEFFLSDGSVVFATSVNDNSDRQPMIVKCLNNGTSCTRVDVSSAYTGGSAAVGFLAAAAYDSVNSRIAIISVESASAAHYFSTDVNVGDIKYHGDIAAAATPTVTDMQTTRDQLQVHTDVGSGKVVAVYATSAGLAKVLHCNLVATGTTTGCIVVDVTGTVTPSLAGGGAGFAQSVASVLVNGKLAIAAVNSNDGSVGLFECTPVGLSCTHSEVAAAGTAATTDPSIDVAYNPSTRNIHVLVRSATGTDVAVFNVAGAIPGPSPSPSPASPSPIRAVCPLPPPIPTSNFRVPGRVHR